jgi:hypothetical protein
MKGKCGVYEIHYIFGKNDGFRNQGEEMDNFSSTCWLVGGWTVYITSDFLLILHICDFGVKGLVASHHKLFFATCGLSILYIYKGISSSANLEVKDAPKIVMRNKVYIVTNF